MVRRPDRRDVIKNGDPSETKLQRCPECDAALVDMGKDFKPPRQHDLLQWRKVSLLYKNGYTFSSCGYGPGIGLVKTLGDVQQLVGKRSATREARILASAKSRHKAITKEKRNERKRRLLERRPVSIKWSFYQINKEDG